MMFEAEFMKWLATLGVGGAIAGFMFMFYRKDVKNYTDAWRGQSEALMTVVKENTAAVTSNTETIRALHAREDKIQDWLELQGKIYERRARHLGE